MAKTQRELLSETLDVDRFKDLGAKIGGLPEPKEFQEKVEDELWQTFTGRENPDESVDYESLPDESKSVTGYVDGDQSAPWWLTFFKWKASSRGEEIILEEGDNFEDELSKIENFDPKATEIDKPSFQNPYNRNTVVDVLEAFRDLLEALDKRIDIDEKSTDLALPHDIFEIGEGSISTTEEFESWFNSLLQFSPPVNSELTSLLMVNTGVKREAIEDVVPAELLEKIDQLDVVSNGEIFERDYYRPLADTMMLSRVFDLVIPGTAKFNELGGLEGLFYEYWAESYDGDQEVSQWINQASDWDPNPLEEGQEPLFGSVAFSVPLRLNRRKPIFTTLGLYSPNSDKSGYYSRTKRRKIEEIMESNGFLEE